MNDIRSPKEKKEPRPEETRVGQGRSPAYPYMSLPKALERAGLVSAAGGTRQALPAETYYKIWQLGPQSSSARQTLAALNHFGLVDYLGRGDERKVKLSELALRILLDKQPNSSERATAIKEAALTPSIHRELFDRYGAILPADVVLETHLMRDSGYNEQAAQTLISEYKETLGFAGLDKPEGGPVSSEVGARQKQVVKAGDYIQWEPAGLLQFDVPRRVRALSDDGGFVFVDGSETGMPIGEVTLQQAPADAAPAVAGSSAVLKRPALRQAETEIANVRVSKDCAIRLIADGPYSRKSIEALVKQLELGLQLGTYDDEPAPAA